MKSESLSLRERLDRIGLVCRREAAASLDVGISYVTTIAFALLVNSIFMNQFFLSGTVDMTGFFEFLPLALAFFLPAISMRLWAEERKQRTVELLLTLPIRPAQAVLGKYFAALLQYALFLACTLPIPIMLEVLGDPDRGLIFAGYLGLLGFGALFLALGSLLSALSKDQIVAFVVTTTLGYVLVLSGNEDVVSILDGLFPSLRIGSGLRNTLSVMPHYEAFVRGVIQLSSLIYFIGASALLLWTCGLVLERNRN